MPRGIYLNQEEKEKIDKLRNDNKNVSQIAQKLNRSRNVVRKYLASPILYGSKIKTSGRKEKCSKRMKMAIRRSASDGSKSLRTIAKEFSNEVSHTTIGKELHEMNIQYVKLKSKPILTKKQKEVRLNYAKDMLRKGESFHQKIIFSDEKRFKLDGPDGCKYYWHDLTKEEQIFSRRKYGGKSLMIWGAIAFDQKIDLYFVETNMKSEHYQTILEDRILPIYNDSYHFQQDNAPPHVSKSSLEWLSDNGIDYIDWPPYSPDLNIIENVWGILTKKVYKGNRTFESIACLRNAIETEWKEFDQEVIIKLYKDFTDRLLAIIERKGALLNC